MADLDENSMFYLSARGIDRREARKLLLRGFSLEALDGSLIDTKATQRVITKTDSMTPTTMRGCRGAIRRWSVCRGDRGVKLTPRRGKREERGYL